MKKKIKKQNIQNKFCEDSLKNIKTISTYIFADIENTIYDYIKDNKFFMNILEKNNNEQNDDIINAVKIDIYINLLKIIYEQYGVSYVDGIK